MNLSDQEIGKKIKQHRKGKMTQQELAQKIGKTESSIRKYEKGLVTIPLDVLEKIASALEISPSVLMGSEQMNKKDVDMLARRICELRVTRGEIEQNWHCVGKHFQSFLQDMSNVMIAGTHNPCLDCKYAMSGLCEPTSWLERVNILSTPSGIDIRWIMVQQGARERKMLGISTELEAKIKRAIDNDADDFYSNLENELINNKINADDIKQVMELVRKSREI